MVGPASYQKRLIQSAVKQVAEHGQWVNGPEVGAFEKAMAAFVGVGHAIGCNSGTDALVLALKALGVGPCDKVVVPAFTFQATAAAVKLVGASPVFADIHEDDFSINPLTAQTRAKAIIGVDMFGIPARWFEINKFAEEHSIPTIDDAAQAIGTEFAYYDEPIMCGGGVADIGCTSFYPSKPLAGIGDGGMVFTNQVIIADKVRLYANHGRLEKPFVAIKPGLNSRLDSLQAAVLLRRLRRMDNELAFRKAQAVFYENFLGVAPRPDCAWSWFPVLYPSSGERDFALEEYGPYGAKVIYPIPLNRMPAFADHAVACPVAESVCERILAFPIKHSWEDNRCINYMREKK